MGTIHPAARGTRAISQRGFTLVELLIVLAIIGLLAAISMAVYGHARGSADEAGALVSLRAINDAQFAFAQTCGNQRFAPTLVSLGTPVPATGHAFLSPDLVAADPVVHQGYQFAMAGTVVTDGTLTCTGVAPVSAYSLTADPVAPGASGTRFFGTNTDRVIFEDSATFVGTMPESGAPGHGSEIK